MNADKDCHPQDQSVAGSRFNFLGKTGETAPASEMLADNNLSNNAAELSKYRFHARTMAKFNPCVNRSFGLRATNPPISPKGESKRSFPHSTFSKLDNLANQHPKKHSVQIHELKMNAQIRFRSATIR
jgi:hypothetical protein